MKMVNKEGILFDVPDDFVWKREKDGWIKLENERSYTIEELKKKSFKSLFKVMRENGSLRLWRDFVGEQIRLGFEREHFTDLLCPVCKNLKKMEEDRIRQGNRIYYCDMPVDMEISMMQRKGSMYLDEEVVKNTDFPYFKLLTVDDCMSEPKRYWYNLQSDVGSDIKSEIISFIVSGKPLIITDYLI